ncbi:MAG: HlyC/CorC family transporter [Gammaproteobacteria bacterium]
MSAEPGIGRPGSLARWANRLLGLFKRDVDERQGLVDSFHEAEQRNVIDPDTVAMMEGALLVSETKVRDIMVPRSEIVMIDEDATPAEFLADVIESGHSRFPVFDDRREHVIGILLAKDLLPLALDDEAPFNLREMLRPVVFVPESKRLNILLREFRERRNHLAVVVDEYGAISGLVTIEDVLEQIVGEIDDEHDLAEEDNIRRHRDERYTVKARTTLEEFNEFFDLDWDASDVDTIGGLVLSELGHLPQRGEEFEYEGFHFKVLRADRRRIRLLRVIRRARKPAPEAD